MGDTRKVKHAGRFGARYGKGIRDRVVGIEKKQRQLHECPSCGFRRVKRVSTGLYSCKKCGFKFAGGAYTPSTMSGGLVRKMVSQRRFLPLAKELIEIKEEKDKGLEEKKAEEKEKRKGKKAKAKAGKGKAEKEKGAKKAKKKKAGKEAKEKPKKAKKEAKAGKKGKAEKEEPAGEAAAAGKGE